MKRYCGRTISKHFFALFECEYSYIVDVPSLNTRLCLCGVDVAILLTYFSKHLFVFLECGCSYIVDVPSLNIVLLECGCS